MPCYHDRLRLHPASPQTERVALRDDVIPLDKPVCLADGRTTSSLRVKAGQVRMLVAFATGNPALQADLDCTVGLPHPVHDDEHQPRRVGQERKRVRAGTVGRAWGCPAAVRAAPWVEWARNFLRWTEELYRLQARYVYYVPYPSHWLRERALRKS